MAKSTLSELDRLRRLIVYQAEQNRKLSLQIKQLVKAGKGKPA